MAVPGVIPLPAKVDYKRQSLAVPGTKRPGQTAIFGQIGVDTPGAYPTLPDVFESGLRLAKDEIFLGHRPLVSKNPLKFADHYVWETYGEADERRRNIGSAIHTLFENGTLGGGEIPTVGLWSQNRPEWVLVDLALNAYKKVGVSLYDTLGDDAPFSIDHAHITAVVATSNHLSYLLQCAPRHPHLKLIVVMDELTPEVQQLASVWAQAQGVKVQGLRELEEFGKKHRRDVIPASPDDIASICYTSGTTSVPKGVLLTHTNMTMSTFSQLHAYVIGPGQRATMLSYLPLAHIYERASELATMALGGGIGFFTGDPLRLLEDAQILKPHFFPSVPRVLNRIYQAAMIAGGAPGLKGAIFRRAVQAKLDILHQTGSVTHPLWDRLVFNKVRAVLGGNVNLISSGAAPVKGDVIDFLRVALCSEVIEGGYGMTENSACCTKTMPGDPTSGGTVGPPQPSMEIKLVDVPTMNYTSEDKPHPRGEVCCRGPAAFKQYYKDEKNTAETVEADGWIHTGDVGEIDDCGRFRIIDRVKNIMKLAQGEYVALEKVENMYSLNPIALQIYVHGNGLKSYLIGVVVADPVQLAALASRVLERKVDEADTATLKALCHEPRIVDAVLASLDGTRALRSPAPVPGADGATPSFEQLRRIHLTLDPFTVEDNTLTPTLKLRRRDAYAKHKVVLDALYDLPDPAPHSSEPAKL
ncbi:long-chain-fatty-acid-CoA ligase [Gloeopeniophorella convolvens]|nr:long-chain-fatty-acid-CoA ligase [Gloeopeniophorella convolvens]